MTDGELDNAHEVREFVYTHFVHTRSFVLIQIGKDSRLAFNLCRNGFEVHIVKDLLELKDLVLGDVRKRYRNLME